MPKSMTGFGKSTCQIGDKAIVVEVKTLNSKTFDVNLRLPGRYREFEQELRNLLAQHLLRGKAELVIGFGQGESPAEVLINASLLEQYYREVTALTEKLGIAPSSDLIPSLLRIPEIASQPQQSTTKEEWEMLRACVLEALETTDGFRTSEGEHLARDISARIAMIQNLLKKVGDFEDRRKDALREKLLRALQDLNTNMQHDPNRFEQELVYYLERIDFSEEKVRLDQHLSYFIDTLHENGAVGKKLGFISQEIGREINTLGSKANDANIQRIVVEMKDELEKIKEQLMNIL